MKVSEIEKLTNHYDKYFQQDDCIVLHPDSKRFHIDAALYPPTDRYPFWKLATIGASDYEMKGKNSLGNRNEYMLFIDPSVDMKDKITAVKYYDLLLKTALFPVNNGVFVSYGHSLEFADESSSEIVGVFLELPQAIEDTGVLRCKLSLFKKAICLQVIPLDKQALERLLKEGNEEFSYTYAYPDNEDEAHWMCKL